MTTRLPKKVMLFMTIYSGEQGDPEGEGEGMSPVDKKGRRNTRNGRDKGGKCREF